MKNTPLISIIIPVYNGSNYVSEAIDSALSQTYDNIEIIVVNDGSNDNGATEKIVLSYGDKVKYIYKENGGVSSALNIGIRNMKGEYFSWLSHDDAYTETKIEDAVNLINEQLPNDKVIACTSGVVIDKDSIERGVFPKRYIERKLYSPNENIKLMLTKGCVNGCALLIPKKAFEICGFFDENLKFCQDALMWYRMFNAGYSVISDNKLNVKSRRHVGQDSQTKQHLFVEDSISISNELIDIFKIHSDNNCNLLYYYAKYSAKYNLTEVVNKCKKNTKMNIKENIVVFSTSLWGKIRRYVRKIYHIFILRIK